MQGMTAEKLDEIKNFMGLVDIDEDGNIPFDFGAAKSLIAEVEWLTWREKVDKDLITEAVTGRDRQRARAEKAEAALAAKDAEIELLGRQNETLNGVADSRFYELNERADEISRLKRWVSKKDAEIERIKTTLSNRHSDINLLIEENKRLHAEAAAMRKWVDKRTVFKSRDMGSLRDEISLWLSTMPGADAGKAMLEERDRYQLTLDDQRIIIEALRKRVKKLEAALNGKE